MKLKIKLLSMVIIAIPFTSCNKDEHQAIDNSNGELCLSSGITTQHTRASFAMDTQIASGQTVAVYVDKADQEPTTPLYANNLITAGGDGSFTGGTPMYFPADKSAVNIYAFHTNSTLADTYPATTITHTVSANQTIPANYAASDLLYAAKKEVAFSKTAVPLTFYHLLSKVEIALKVGAGTPNLTGAKVSLGEIKLKADFTPNKQADVTQQAARATMIAATTADNAATDIAIGNEVTTDANWKNGSYTYNEAVIVSQAVAKGAKFIKVELTNGGVLHHKLETATTFASGKRYSYQITVNLTELSVTSTIADWEAVNPVKGSAEME